MRFASASTRSIADPCTPSTYWSGFLHSAALVPGTAGCYGKRVVAANDVSTRSGRVLRGAGAYLATRTERLLSHLVPQTRPVSTEARVAADILPSAKTTAFPVQTVLGTPLNVLQKRLIAFDFASYQKLGGLLHLHAPHVC
eukprot:3625949-Rhodomonas_salina.2